jgi:hypothetical protein
LGITPLLKVARFSLKLPLTPKTHEKHEQQRQELQQSCPSVLWLMVGMLASPCLAKPAGAEVKGADVTATKCARAPKPGPKYFA